jgi:hypothetical protein
MIAINIKRIRIKYNINRIIIILLCVWYTQDNKYDNYYISCFLYIIYNIIKHILYLNEKTTLVKKIIICSKLFVKL